MVGSLAMSFVTEKWEFEWGKHWKTRWWFQRFFIFIPTWGFMIPFDEHSFQMGWFNHQLDCCCNLAGFLEAGGFLFPIAWDSSQKTEAMVDALPTGDLQFDTW